MCGVGDITGEISLTKQSEFIALTNNYGLNRLRGDTLDASESSWIVRKALSVSTIRPGRSRDDERVQFGPYRHVSAVILRQDSSPRAPFTPFLALDRVSRIASC